MARSVTKPEIAMLVGVGLAALLSAAFVEPFVAFGQLIGVSIWSAIIYGLVYVAYWVSQNREKVPERFHFLVVCSFVLSIVILFSDVLKAGQSPSAGMTKQTGDQQAAQQDALAKQDAEQQAAKAQEAQIRASLTDSAYMIKTAMNHTTAVTQLAALQTVSTEGCPPEFRVGLVDLVYAMEQVVNVDQQRARLASDETLNETVITQILQVLVKSNDSAVYDALSDDQKLIKARELWTGKVDEAEHNLTRVLAQYGLQP